MLSRILFLSAFFLATPAVLATADLTDDPYIWLEDVWGARSLDWVNAENARTLAILKGDPRYGEFYAEALKIAEATDRIPMPRLTGDRITNFWRDAAHPHGLWRVTSATDYLNSEPNWTTLIDLDALSAK
jgi:prolyl oligopeptidase